MTTVDFSYNGRIVKGILLGKYRRTHYETVVIRKKRLWKTQLSYESVTLNTPLYALFIPWRHQEKEIVELDEKYIVDPESISFDESWIKIDNFTSETLDSGFPASVEINNFVGYKFIYENNNFIADLVLSERWKCLSTVYQNMPEFLEIDLDNLE